MRTLDELLTTDDPAWPVLQDWVAESRHSIQVLKPDESTRKKVLHDLQVSLASTLGAIVWHTGGMLVDHGWLRILGCGSHQLKRTPLTWPERMGWQADTERHSTAPVIADDILGGMFALNWGFFGTEAKLNDVFYFAPDSLKWESLGVGYSVFIQSMLSEPLSAFYEELRWPGWEDEIRNLGADQGISLFPPLWSKEGKNPEKVSRRVVPVDELPRLHQEIANQLGRDSASN